MVKITVVKHKVAEGAKGAARVEEGPPDARGGSLGVHVKDGYDVQHHWDVMSRYLWVLVVAMVVLVIAMCATYRYVTITAPVVVIQPLDGCHPHTHRYDTRHLLPHDARHVQPGHVEPRHVVVSQCNGTVECGGPGTRCTEAPDGVRTRVIKVRVTQPDLVTQHDLTVVDAVTCVCGQ